VGSRPAALRGRGKDDRPRLHFPLSWDPGGIRLSCLRQAPSSRPGGELLASSLLAFTRDRKTKLATAIGHSGYICESRYPDIGLSQVLL
jgi:hypothetical protein